MHFIHLFRNKNDQILIIVNFVLILNLHNKQFFFLKIPYQNYKLVYLCTWIELVYSGFLFIQTPLSAATLHHTFKPFLKHTTSNLLKKIAIRIFKRCLGSRLDQNPFKIVQEIWSIWIIGVWITEVSLYTIQTNFSIKKITLWFQPYLMPSAFEH